MVARRALVVFLVVDAQFPEKPFHIPHVLAVFIARLIHAFFRNGADLANNVCVAFVVGEPPVLDLGELPDCGEGGAESRGDDVSVKQPETSILGSEKPRLSSKLTRFVPSWQSYAEPTSGVSGLWEGTWTPCRCCF